MSSRRSRGDVIDSTTFDMFTRRAGQEMQPDADLDAMEFGLTLVRAGNRLQQDLETHVHRPAGMTWAAFRILFVIRSVGKTSPRQVAHLSSISAASVSSVLNTLERYGMITRTRSESDGRGITLSLTDEGERAVTQLFIRNNRRAAEWASMFTASERATLISLLRRVLEFDTSDPKYKDDDPEPIREIQRSRPSKQRA